MASINAKRAAQKVSENVRKGKRVILGEILKEVGYSDAISKKPTHVTSTKSFQNEMAVQKKSTLELLDAEIARIQKAIARKNLDNEEYRTLQGSLDISIKNRQLLSGGATERQVFVLPSEVMARHAIVERKPDELPAGTSNDLPAGSTGTPATIAEPLPDVPATT